MPSIAEGKDERSITTNTQETMDEVAIPDTKLNVNEQQSENIYSLRRKSEETRYLIQVMLRRQAADRE
jgi:hypothetical protein